MFFFAFLMLAWLVGSAPSPVFRSSEGQTLQNYTETVPGTSFQFEMIAIPGGTFVRGSAETEAGRKEDEGPQHSVTVSPFWLAQTEVTWDLYEEFYFGAAPSGLPPEVKGRVDAVSRPTPPYGAPDLGWGTGLRPAMSMTFYAAEKYCEWLSALTGKHYRLPTSAEWEYACRAGTSTAYFFGNDPSQLGEYAWYDANSERMTHEVATRKPNPWGLFDMPGNVAEFCGDWYSAGEYRGYANGRLSDPLGPDSGQHRTVRGGSYQDDGVRLRCAARVPTTEQKCLVTDPNLPKSKWWYADCFNIGIRVARSAPPGAGAGE